MACDRDVLDGWIHVLEFRAIFIEVTMVKPLYDFASHDFFQALDGERRVSISSHMASYEDLELVVVTMSGRVVALAEGLDVPSIGLVIAMETMCGSKLESIANEYHLLLLVHGRSRLRMSGRVGADPTKFLSRAESPAYTRQSATEVILDCCGHTYEKALSRF